MMVVFQSLTQLASLLLVMVYVCIYMYLDVSQYDSSLFLFTLFSGPE